MRNRSTAARPVPFLRTAQIALFLSWLAPAILISTTTLGQEYRWHRHLAGNLPNNESTTGDVAVDDAENVYVVGHFAGTIDFNGNGSSATTLTAQGPLRDIFFAKYSSNGNLQYVKRIGASNGNCSATGVALYRDGSNNVFLYISGYFRSTNSSSIAVNFDPDGSPGGSISTSDTDGDAVIAKYNANSGAFAWVRQLNNSRADFEGGGRLCTDNSGNAYHVSRRDANTNDCILRKYASDGTAGFTRIIGDNSAGSYDVTFGNNTLYVCGQNLENDDRPIQWYDTSGNPQGSAGATNKLFNRITLDTGNGIYVGGNGTSGSIYIEKYTPSSGTNPVWNKSFSSGIQFGGFSIDLDFGKESGDLMVAGWFQGTVDFNSPGSYSSTLTSSGSGNHDNVYVARYAAASGNCEWVKNNVTYSNGQADPIAVACSNQHVHVVGIVVSTTMNASFCGNAANIVADNASNAYLAKYTQRLFPPASILGASYTLPGETEEYYVSTPTPPGVKSYQWYVPSGWNITYTSSDQSYIFAGVGNADTDGNVAARAVYDCGNSGLAFRYVEVGGDFGLRSIYPNPASDNLTVDIEPSKNEVSITLTSESGKPLKQGKLKSKEEKLTLPVADLARGRYYLVLKRGDKSLGKQVVIEH